MNAARPPVWWWARLGLSVLLVCNSVPAAGALPELIWRSDAGRLPAYRVGIASRVAHARRSDFTRPVFLVQQSVEQIIARELVNELFFQFQLFPALFADFRVPYIWRQAEVLYAPVVISAGEQLPKTWVDLESHGVSDTEARLVLRAYESAVFMTQLGVGILIPRDDNPGSSTVPTRLPLGSGQTALLLEPSLEYAGEHWSLGGHYRFAFHPGDVSTYLIRKVDSQSYAAGALAPFLTHSIRIWTEPLKGRRFALRLAPELTIAENPLVVARGQTIRVIDEMVRYDFGLEVSLRCALRADHTLSMFYKHWFLKAWERDPFFPIHIPDQGFGIAWEVRSF